MSAARVPFDISQPFIVSAGELPCGDKKYARGDAFNWKSHGLTSFELLQLWNACQVDCVAPTAATVAQPASPSSSKQQGRRDKR